MRTHLIRMEEPRLPLVYSQNPVCSVKHWQRHTAVQFGSQGLEQTAARASILLSSLLITLKVSCALFLVLNRSWGNPITACHTLRSGDCGWHRSEISIASTVQAVSLQRPSWTTGLICLYYTLPSYDLIWLKVWLRKEDWPKPQLGILFALVSVFSSDWTRPEETSEDVFTVLKLLCSIVIWGLLQHGNEIRTGQIVYPFWHRWKESTLRTPTLPPNSSRRPVYLCLWPLYTGKKVFHILLPSILVILVWKQMLSCADKDPLH